MKLAPLFLAAAAASTLFVTGCGRPAFLVFDRNSAYQEALGFTREGEVRNYFETKALVTATYMNPLDGERFKDGEFFFVGLYIDDDFEGEKGGLNNPFFRLTLNGEIPLEYYEVEEEDPMLKTMPLVNRWSRYYVVRFPETAEGALTLTLVHESTASVSLPFSKGPSK